MTEPTSQPPALDVDAADERTTLIGFLNYYRSVLARKAEGLSDIEAAAATCPPSDITILGLIRHMTEVEHGWAHGFTGVARSPIYCDAAHPDGDPDGDFHPPDGARLDDALSAYWAEIGDADQMYAKAALDEIERAGGADSRRRSRSLRWIYVHLIEEYARHCGHADLIREAIDGVTGD